MRYEDDTLFQLGLHQFKKRIPLTLCRYIFFTQKHTKTVTHSIFIHMHHHTTCSVHHSDNLIRNLIHLLVAVIAGQPLPPMHPQPRIGFRDGKLIDVGWLHDTIAGEQIRKHANVVPLLLSQFGWPKAGLRFQTTVLGLGNSSTWFAAIGNWTPWSRIGWRCRQVHWGVGSWFVEEELGEASSPHVTFCEESTTSNGTKEKKSSE